MPDKERSLVKGIALDTWGDIRKRPLMWLILAASSIPLIFFYDFFAPGLALTPAFSQTTYFIFLFVGYCTCFCIFFLFWCMAVNFYDDNVRRKGKLSYGGSYRKMVNWGLSSVWAGLVCGLVNLFAYMIAQIAVGMILSFFASGQTGEGTEVILSYLYNFFLSFLAADLIIVFIVMVPQMLFLEGGRRVEEVLKASYRLVKERYRDAILLFIIPEIITRVFFLGAYFVAISMQVQGVVFTLLLLSMALLSGARTAFVAAAFNRFYYHILEEEKKKKRKGKPKKQAARKQAAKGKGKKR